MLKKINFFIFLFLAQSLLQARSIEDLLTKNEAPSVRKIGFFSYLSLSSKNLDSLAGLEKLDTGTLKILNLSKNNPLQNLNTLSALQNLKLLIIDKKKLGSNSLVQLKNSLPHTYIVDSDHVDNAKMGALIALLVGAASFVLRDNGGGHGGDKGTQKEESLSNALSGRVPGTKAPHLGVTIGGRLPSPSATTLFTTKETSGSQPQPYLKHFQKYESYISEVKNSKSEGDREERVNKAFDNPEQGSTINERQAQEALKKITASGGKQTVGRANRKARTYLNSAFGSEHVLTWQAIHNAAIKGTLSELPWPVDLNANNNFSASPLHVAAYAGNNESVEWLLAQNAQKNALDCCMYTSLHLAAAQGHADVVKTLLEKNVAIWSANRKTPIDLAIEQKRVNVLSVFITKAKTATKVEECSVCVQEEYESLKEKMLSSPEIIPTIVDAGFDLLEKDMDGNTLLHRAAIQENKKAFDTLHSKLTEEQKSSLKELKNNTEKTAIELAKNNGWQPSVLEQFTKWIK